MLWTLQLSPWALPPLLAVLIAARELLFLWPRRREPSSRGLLALTAAGGAWALCHLVAVASPHLDVKVALERVQYVATAVVPAAWVVFALTYTSRDRLLYRPGMVGLYALCLVTAALAASGRGFSFLVRDTAIQTLPSGLVGLTLHYGPWFWVQMAVRLTAVILASALLAGHVSRTPGSRLRAVVPAAACVLALGPSVAHLAARTGAQWLDLSPTGTALAAALLGWGLLRHRLLDLGPVARTLVMVELRDPIVVLDARGRIVDVNRAAEERLGLQPYGDVPVNVGRLWAASRGSGSEAGQVLLPVIPTPDQPDPERTFEMTLTSLGRKEGTGRTALLFRDVTARVLVEQRLRDTTEALREANTELERRANTDPLTALANRRRLREALRTELERAERYDRPLAVLLLDLDHFKHVNDSWGHAAGDQVLRRVAEEMRAVCRDIDLPARLGGEELAVLLPETDAKGAQVVAERLRSRVAEARHTSPEGRTFEVTTSIGVAAVGPEGGTVDSVLHQADRALYAAKEAGRNRVRLADPRPPDPAAPA